MRADSDDMSMRLRGRDVFYVTLVTFGLTSVGIAAIVELAEISADNAATSRKLNLAVLFGSILLLNGSLFLAVKIVLMRAGEMSWQTLGFAWPGARWIAGAIALGIILVATIEGIERVFEISAGQLTSWLIAPDGFTWVGLVGGVLFIGLLAPFGEELLFRGLVYRWLKDLWGPMTAAPISATLFASAHFYYPLPHMLLVAFLGLVLAISYERSASIWVPIGIHAAQNTTVVVLIYFSLH